MSSLSVISSPSGYTDSHKLYYATYHTIYDTACYIACHTVCHTAYYTACVIYDTTCHTTLYYLPYYLSYYLPYYLLYHLLYYHTSDIMELEQQHTQPNLAEIGRRIHGRLTALESYDRLVIQAQRYELWAGNLGLYQSGHSSLDYRFRDAPSIHTLTFRLLTHLEETLSTSKS